MKKITLLFLSFSLALGSFAQDDQGTDDGRQKKVASVILEDMDGNEVNTADLGFDGPIIISFWATWCSTCKRELNTIHELYTDWQADYGVNLVAVSIDDEKTKNSVPMYVNGKNWEYLVLMDPNGDFKRAMGVNNVPHKFLIDTDGNIVATHTTYSPGDEYELEDELKEMLGIE